MSRSWALLTVVVGFVFGGWDVSDRFEDPAMVEPVDVGEGGQLDVLEAAPRSLPVDEFETSQRPRWRPSGHDSCCVRSRIATLESRTGWSGWCGPHRAPGRLRQRSG